MEISGEYVPSKLDWVREQIAEYEASNGTRANTLRDTGVPIVVVTMRGASTGLVRKVALMRVEHKGSYALVASYAGSDKHPSWYHNIMANPGIMLQDGPSPRYCRTRELTGSAYADWWERAVKTYPRYREYREKTSRPIPIVLAEPVLEGPP